MLITAVAWSMADSLIELSGVNQPRSVGTSEAVQQIQYRVALIWQLGITGRQIDRHALLCRVAKEVAAQRGRRDHDFRDRSWRQDGDWFLSTSKTTAWPGTEPKFRELAFSLSSTHPSDM